eukprot:2750541-Prymnesium_polylepis.1
MATVPCMHEAACSRRTRSAHTLATRGAPHTEIPLAQTALILRLATQVSIFVTMHRNFDTVLARGV